MKKLIGAVKNKLGMPQTAATASASLENNVPAEDFELHRAFVPESWDWSLSDNTDSLSVAAEQAEAFLTEVGLVGLTYSIEDSVLIIFYAEDGQAYNLTQYRSGYGWSFSSGTHHLVAGNLTYNGSFSFLEFQKIIKKELASIRGQLPGEATGEEASFFMMQLRRQTNLRLSEWFPYVGRDLSWQRMLLFGEAYVPVEQIEEAKLLPDEWIRKMFTPPNGWLTTEAPIGSLELSLSFPKLTFLQ